MAPDVWYEIREVARAVGIPARRLEGWIERGVLVPTIRAKGTGTRSRFTRPDVLRVAIVAEIQRLLGTDLRPGSIASAIGSDPLTLPLLDTVLDQAAKREADPKGAERLVAEPRSVPWLYVRPGKDGRPSIGATRKGPADILKIAPVLVVINPLELWFRIQSRLEH